MTVFIDADACPVMDISIAVARRHNAGCVIVYDTAHVIEREHAVCIVCDKGSDSVDRKLFNMIKKGDVCVTQDYGLAAMCLGKGAYALNQNGLIYSDKNIENLLYTRYINIKTRGSGKKGARIKKRDVSMDKAFEAALDKILSRAEQALCKD